MSRPNSNSMPYILAIDDEPMNLMILDDLIDGQYPLVGVESAKAGFEQIKIHKPDLILLDVHMPEMDGFEMCRQLKQVAETQDIPVIFLTAKAEERYIEEGLAVGAESYITKPFTELELIEAIEGFMV